MVSWKIVKPRLVRITFIWGLMLLLVFYLQKLWNFNFNRNKIIMQTEYMAPNCHVSFIWMQSLSNVFLFNMIKKSVSRLFIVILLHCVVEYSLNQFPCHRHVFFLWKPWINKLVTLCSHDHFQFEFHLISQIYHSIEGRLAYRKSRRTDFSQFSSLWMLLWVFTPTSCSHRIFPGFSLVVPTFQCKAAFSSVTKLLWVHWKFEMNLISVESNKMWQNISKLCQRHFAFNCQLSA